MQDREQNAMRVHRRQIDVLPSSSSGGGARQNVDLPSMCPKRLKIDALGPRTPLAFCHASKSASLAESWPNRPRSAIVTSPNAP
jgi:hypothetical protein